MGLFKRKPEPTETVGPAPPMLVQPMQQQSQYPQQNQPMPYPQPQLPEKRALIVGIEILQDGEYAFKVVTNYQLGFGECIINQ